MYSHSARRNTLGEYCHVHAERGDEAGDNGIVLVVSQRLVDAVV